MHGQSNHFPAVVVFFKEKDGDLAPPLVLFGFLCFFRPFFVVGKFSSGVSFLVVEGFFVQTWQVLSFGDSGFFVCFKEVS